VTSSTIRNVLESILRSVLEDVLRGVRGAYSECTWEHLESLFRSIVEQAGSVPSSAIGSVLRAYFRA